MRLRLAMVSMLAFALVVAIPAGGAGASPAQPNTTCRIDAAVVQAVLEAKVDCLQLDVEKYGEMEGHVTVTLQQSVDDVWVNLASERCTDTSTQGVLNLHCSASSPAGIGGTLRGLIDLDAPQDWIPAVAEPTYTGGRPVADPLADDACDINETAEPSDLTPPDAPWVDLCAVTMDSTLDEEGHLTAADVVTYVGGGLQERLANGAWTTNLAMDSGCTHEITVEDTDTGVPLVRVDTGCEHKPGECTGISKILTDILGGVCASSGTFDVEETATLPADAVTFGGDTITVTLRPEQLTGLLARDIALGSVVESASATSSAGVRNGSERAIYDGDLAWSTGRSYTIGD